MRINYSILDRCRHNLLYEPISCLKLYNCLILPEEILIDSKSVTFKSTDGGKDYNRHVVRVDGDRLFFGFGFSEPLDLSGYELVAGNTTYNLGNAEMVVGSILIDNPNLMPLINSSRNFRLITHSENSDTFLSFEANNVSLLNDLYIAFSSCIEIDIGNNAALLSALSESSEISVQPLDNGILKKDVKLYLEVYGGNAFLINDRPMYKMILKDLVYNNTIEKNITFTHLEQNLDLRRYELSILDQDNTPITKVNGLDFQEDKLVIDIASGSVTGFSLQSTDVDQSSLSQLFEIFTKG